MQVREIGGSSCYQAHLQVALDDAVSACQKAHEAVSRHPLTEETAAGNPELTLLYYALEQRRATALVLAACCVEALANLYLAHKTTPEQFAILEWTRFLEKWTVLPSLFVPGYSFPKDGELYQDLKRLNARRNALVHLKEEVSREGSILHPGSHPDVASDENVFIGRCRSLPDRLLAHLASFDETEAIMQVKGVLAIAHGMREMQGERSGGLC
jgi:hypothetical protein